MTIEILGLTAPAARPGPASDNAARPAVVSDKRLAATPTDTVTLSDQATVIAANASGAAAPVVETSDADAPSPLDALRAAFMATADSDNWDASVDFNDDSIVNFQDMAALRAQMASAGQAPEPTVDDIRNAFLAGEGDRGWNGAADLNADGQINFGDLAALRERMAAGPAAPEVSLSAVRDAFLADIKSDNWNPAADLDGDGQVNFADLALLRARLSDEA